MTTLGMGRTRRGLAATLAALALGAVGLAGCGKRSVIYTGEDTDPTSTSAPSINFGLPFKIQQAKVINVGSDISYPPMESLPSGATAPQGADVDIANALGGKLGVQFVFQNAKFEGLVTGLVNNKYDVVMSAMKDTGSRRGQGVDFIDYFTDGAVIIVPKGNPKKIDAPSDLCGRTVAVPDGTAAQDFLKAQSATCPAAPGGGPATTVAGKNTTGSSVSSTTSTTRKTTTTVKGTSKTTVATGKIIVMPVADSAAAAAAVKSGRAIAAMDELPLAASQVLAANGALQLTGDPVQTVPYGIAVRVADTQLRDAIASAMKAIIADGSYAAILQKWALGQGTIGEVSINSGS